MSSIETVAPPALAAPGSSPLWRTQIAAILRLEARKSFLGRRGILLYLAAFLPVFAMACFAVMVVYFGSPNERVPWATNLYAAVYQHLFLRAVIYFGCTWAFINAFRGEVLDRSLHYYLLAPVRREVLVVGKFLAALLATTVLFGGSTLISFTLVHLPYGSEGVSQLLSAAGLKQLLGYGATTFFGCVGYGAIFLLLGLFLRNPILPAVVIFVWEWVSFLLPPLLKKITISHYLKSIAPVPVSEGPLALVADPTPRWLAILGLTVLAGILVTLSALRTRQMEVEYGEE